MATTKRNKFTRRLPDHITDSLVKVLARQKKDLDFNELFEKVFLLLKEKSAVSGGEEMLRLRAYEKLQNLVSRGLVEKNGKKYRGVPNISQANKKASLALGV